MKQNKTKLEQAVFRRIVLTILLGCLFFSIAFLCIYIWEQTHTQNEHLEMMADGFNRVYEDTEEFLRTPANRETMIGCLETPWKKDKMRYLVSSYNASAAVDLRLVLFDASGNVRFHTFPDEDFNLHRRAFTQFIANNAVEKDALQQADIYETVYFFAGKNAEYAMSMPVYDKEELKGVVTVFLDSEDWTVLLDRYQYDAVITNSRNDVIYCSNTSFLGKRGANKFAAPTGKYVKVGDSRYRVATLTDERRNIRIYSFVYEPKNYTYIMIGVITILMLGVLWTVSFREAQALYAKNIELAGINGRMEVRNLQDRMNPHFIYNTLDTIKYLIAFEPKQATEMIEHFTHILRYSINETMREVTIAEDMEYLADYLFIQKIRFGDRFTFDVNVEPDTEVCKIPKLLIQPIVENSLKYGFTNQMNLHVRVHCYKEEEYLHMTVEDNGGGVTEEELCKLQSYVSADNNETQHNGLHNIARRLALTYGGDSGMELDSKDGAFIVRIKLKCC